MNSRPILLKDCLYSPSIRICVQPPAQPLGWRGNRNYSTSIGGERVKMKEESADFNKQWFIGFCDAESSFSINPVVNSENFIKKITFMFSIELHKDDLNVLEDIKNYLGIGRVRQYKDKCIFSVTNAQGTYKLISIFDEYNLNSTKHLDYLLFKRAFLLYQGRDKRLFYNQDKAKTLTNQIFYFKNSMNTKRTNSVLPLDHNIVITKGWLLGYIEGDGSFFVSRTDIEPTLSISATAEQWPLFEKIK